MATLQSYVDKLPPLLKNRFSTGGYFIQWMNELLEELQERGFMPSIKKEAGKIVKNEQWVEKPTDLITLLKVMDASNRDRQIRVEEIEGKFRLLDCELTDQSASEQTLCTAFSDYAVGSVKVNLTGYGEDSFEDYLFLITAGTYAGRAYILNGNDASGVSDTKVYFMHDLPAALDGTMLTAARLVPPEYYLLLQYIGKYVEVTAHSEEVPVDNDFEKRLIPTWLTWKGNLQMSLVSQETAFWGAEVERVLASIEAGRNSAPVNQAKGRRLIGFERRGDDSMRSDNRSFTEVHG